MTIEASNPEFSLADTFNAFAKKAVAHFPELAPGFAIYYAPTDTLYGHFSEDQKERLLEIARKHPKVLSAAAVALHPLGGGEGYYLINYYLDSPERPISNLKHELGHLAAPCGVSEVSIVSEASIRHGYNFSECVAEVFSFLYEQQTQPREGRPEDSNYKAALRLMLEGGIDHFYLPVLQALEKLSTSYDLSSVEQSPLQAANFAYRLSLLYAPQEQDLEKLMEIFKPVEQATMGAAHAAYRYSLLDDNIPKEQKLKKPVPRDFDMPPYEECARIMFEDHGQHSRMAFMAGKAFLEPVLNKRGDIAERESKHFHLFEGAFWDGIREKIKQRSQKEEEKTPEQRLAQEAKDMMVFGRFDKDPDNKIDPEIYESTENMAYLQRAMNAYIKLKSVEGAALDQEQTIALARKIAKQPAPKAAAAPPSLGV